MSVGLAQYLLVCPLVFVAGFIDSVAGGGGLISLPAYLIAGLPVHFALGTNKLSSSMGTALATWRYAKSGLVPWRLAALCAAAALAGSNLGARLSVLLDERYFSAALLVVLPLTALYVLRGRSLERERPPLSSGKTLLISLVVAFFLGGYDGLYGPGTGSFLLLLLTGAAHIPLERANGVTKVINLASNLSALAVFLSSGRVIIPFGLAAGLFSLAGNYLGSRCFLRGGARAAKPVILVVLAVFFVKVLLELVG